ncbi:MAG: response regulator [Myxococcota bacterium]
MKVADILLVEDNPGDVLLVRKGLERARIANRLTVATDGQQALDILFRRGEHADAVVPDLVLLDLNLPGIDGREVLRQIKEHETLRKVPVVVLTSSDAETDILRSYELHANSFIRKPPTLDALQQVLQVLSDYWFVIVKLPEGE